MTYTTIAEKIEDILETVNSLAEVHDHEPNELGKYPAATISSTGHSGEFRSTRDNLRTVRHTVRVYFLLTEGRNQDAEVQVRTVMDDIMSAFDTNPTLNGSCLFATPVSATIDTAEREVPTKVAEIVIEAKGLVSRV